jgi:hypothetical protein
LGVRRMLIQTVGNWCSTVGDCYTIELMDKRGNCEQGINHSAEVLKSEVCDFLLKYYFNIYFLS